ncbi:RNA-binding protein EIF1AD [Biomphalaria glabrata]|uniref:Probable RNA-binding protein EIF1AD n=1 Tax=Biomphalaria glabrata TaxID=6526 RepID=A0A9W3A0Z8_BIOGL|nr:probable RNA-binding protein EIF1AD [Biomphalaria glabrata]XP_013077885.2 probable RNA-binding protein EIF1AD [Biomphalaria glabrata]XP_013077886.2 probable RNA-binding protein EIF1AD [Biomphalaria glabrata]XP_055880875.1 probable RNA-binding protein EIF1AD [Biomphalaria glabrata]XP_055880876.1 probable RNA-binding protein EIF1AD [Biomphalaria glabrata]XP_055880877.1 probable RNA-binding protein EIF1AD [Biomphalaria glabrata]KAI8746830.1 putative RNA-binding protein EIF1AD [Biomphalaria gl
MSATTKKKHVTKEVLEEYPLPEGNKQIVKVTAAKGNNLHEVIDAEGETFLVSMPTKFRKHVWIKRGDYIMVEPIGEGDKVKGEITHILFKEQIKYIQEKGLWPAKFSTTTNQQQSGMIPSDLLPPSDEDDDDDGDNLSDLVRNLNRVEVTELESESEDSCSEEEEEVDEDDSQEENCNNSSNSKLTKKSDNTSNCSTNLSER